VSVPKTGSTVLWRFRFIKRPCLHPLSREIEDSTKSILSRDKTPVTQSSWLSGIVTNSISTEFIYNIYDQLID